MHMFCLGLHMPLDIRTQVHTRKNPSRDYFFGYKKPDRTHRSFEREFWLICIWKVNKAVDGELMFHVTNESHFSSGLHISAWSTWGTLQEIWPHGHHPQASKVLQHGCWGHHRYTWRELYQLRWGLYEGSCDHRTDVRWETLKDGACVLVIVIWMISPESVLCCGFILVIKPVLWITAADLWGLGLWGGLMQVRLCHKPIKMQGCMLLCEESSDFNIAFLFQRAAKQPECEGMRYGK